MCGIAGRFNFDGHSVDRGELNKMCLAISHRGPDNQGAYIKGPVGLGSRRLSIIDLSDKGNQPMSNETKTVWVVNNGEIYNFKELRQSLIKRGHKFRSRTDTEVIVHLWEEHGVECLKFLRGMFAFALWDDKQKILLLARDRLGQKPLKYFLDDKSLIFASELKAILKVKGIKREPDLKAIDHFFSLEAVPAPMTGFKGIKKLPQSSYLLIKNGKTKIRKYWSLKFLPKHQANQAELKQEILEQLTESVRLRLVADVPVGAFLSGGIDSSAMVALIHRLGHRNINTFSVGFKEEQYSEIKYARMMAKKFKTDHHEAILKPQSFSLLSELAKAYEEPYGDPSALPTYLISQLASKKLKVVLSGDGGDDIFAGYQRYQKIGPLNLISRLVPQAAKPLVKLGLRLPRLIDKKTQRLIDLIDQPGFGQYAAAYLGLNSPLSFKQELYKQEFLNEVDPLASQKLILKQKKVNLTPLDNVLLGDINIYLAQVLLPKVDIASMSHSLEVRSPFLDHKLVEFVNKIPSELKLNRGRSKYILKKALEGILPKEIIYRKKMGFSFPLGKWLKNQWKKDVSHLLLNKKAMIKNYLNQEMIEKMINQPSEGDHHDRRLWRIVMFELWLQHYFAK